MVDGWRVAVPVWVAVGAGWKVRAVCVDAVLDRVPGGVAGTFCGCWKRDGLLEEGWAAAYLEFADGFALKGYAVALVCWLSVVYMYSGPLLMHLIFASQIFWLLQVLRMTIVAAFS
ncbi:hypothetical protein Nepgr_023014 [Nepenthes gracilis]|uniref:Uncharacterized protein n=1 Tax=Nepenthes gracilis TaxID=150966 RepID=A0AAD3T1W3_NEPGR|nr:hypothetical protein Nepgr_023014 [Nepenthes gracilis]